MSRLAAFVSLLALCAPASAETLKILALRSEPFYYEKDGRPAGIEHDILEYFAKSRNATLEIEFVDSFSSLLERIQAKEADIAAGTITITKERASRLAFSAGYFPVQVVLVESMSASTKSLAELTGAKVGAFVDTTAEDALRAAGGIQIVNDGTLEEMMAGIEKGQLRAAAADSSAVIPALDAYPSLKIGLALSEQQAFGFAMPKGSPLEKDLSDHVRRLKESGIYFRIVTQHMGARASEIVRAAKIE
jgi:ABC-type amino acid transport substrate-binding protein